MSEWQPIETAPKDGTEIDLWCIIDGVGQRVADAKFCFETRNGFGDPIPDIKRWVVWDFDVSATEFLTSVYGDITHWMHLPPPPK